MKYTQRGFGRLLVIVVITAILVVAGAFIYRHTVSNDDIETNIVEEPVIPNYLIYTNNAFGFQIQYPKNLVPIESIDCEPERLDADCEVNFSTHRNGEGTTKFSVLAFKGRGGTLQENAEMMLAYGKDTQTLLMKTTIQGKEALYADVSDEKTRGRIYFLKPGSDFYMLTFVSDVDQSAISATFKILSKN